MTNPLLTDTVEVKFRGAPIILELVAKGIIGGKTLLLVDESGLLELKVPAQLWQFIEPGDHIHMTFSPVKVDIVPVAVPLPGLPRGEVN